MTAQFRWQKIQLLVMVGAGLTLVACSTSKQKAASSEQVAEAGTDEVPVTTSEIAPEAGALQDPVAPQVPADVGLTSEVQDYTVQREDTLMKIAFQVYGNLNRWKEIYEGNKDAIGDPSRLKVGTVLKLSKPSAPVALEQNGERYLIQQGDTLGKISNQLYGTSSRWKDLWNNNRQLIRDPNKIFAGFYLFYVPGEGGAVSQSSGQPSSDGISQGGSEMAAGAGDLSPLSAPTTVPAAPSLSMDSGTTPEVQAN